MSRKHGLADESWCGGVAGIVVVVTCGLQGGNEGSCHLLLETQIYHFAQNVSEK